MEGLRRSYIPIISPESAKKLALLVLCAVIFDFTFFSLPVWAAENDLIATTSNEINMEDDVLYLKNDNSDMVLLKSAEIDHLLVTDYSINTTTEQTADINLNTASQEPEVIDLSIKRKVILEQKLETKPVERNLVMPLPVKQVTPKIDPNAKAMGKRTVLMTAYNSEVSQTDGSPCITATGFNVCKHGIEDTIAANFLKFGTKVKIPALYGDRIFIVRDRMNKRYTNKVDIWMKNKSDALKFGVKSAQIVVVE